MSKDLSSRDAFYEPSQVKENYEIAHSEFARWFWIVGKSSLAELIEGVNKGERLMNCIKQSNPVDRVGKR